MLSGEVVKWEMVRRACEDGAAVRVSVDVLLAMLEYGKVSCAERRRCQCICRLNRLDLLCFVFVVVLMVRWPSSCRRPSMMDFKTRNFELVLSLLAC